MSEDSILPVYQNASWSVEVIMASSDKSKLLKPVVRLTLHFIENTADEPVELELDMKTFGEFRYKLANALKLINDVEKNKAPI